MLLQHCFTLVCENTPGPLRVSRAVLTSHRLPFLVNPRQTGVEVDIGRLPARKRGDVVRTHVNDPLARLDALPADVWGQDEVVEAVERAVVWQCRGGVLSQARRHPMPLRRCGGL